MESRPADGRDEAETFQERATYTTHGEDKDNKAQTDYAYAKAGSEDEDEDKDAAQCPSCDALNVI